VRFFTIDGSLCTCCAAVGQLIAQCAWARGAGRVISIDEVPARLQKVQVRFRLRTFLHPVCMVAP
jgi:threonine dehydrogenase-like Zn-dependent dehydrogenase